LSGVVVAIAYFPAGLRRFLASPRVALALLLDLRLLLLGRAELGELRVDDEADLGARLGLLHRLEHVDVERLRNDLDQLGGLDVGRRLRLLEVLLGERAFVEVVLQRDRRVRGLLGPDRGLLGREQVRAGLQHEVGAFGDEEDVNARVGVRDDLHGGSPFRGGIANDSQKAARRAGVPPEVDPIALRAGPL
jgi:hypothetical protein